MSSSPHPGLSNPEDWEEAAVQAPVALAALGFLKTIVQDKDLAGAWHMMDPHLRSSWVNAWVEANLSSITREGHNLEALRADLTDGDPDQALWPHFSRVTLREVASLVPSNPDHWGIGATARVAGIDLELLYLHDTEGRSGVVWQPGEAKHVVPVLMRHVDGEWKVLNLGSESIPS